MLGSGQSDMVTARALRIGRAGLAIALFVILAAAVRLAMAGGPLLMQLGALVVLLALFARIVWKKTEGDWRWRWGSVRKEK